MGTKHSQVLCTRLSQVPALAIVAVVGLAVRDTSGTSRASAHAQRLHQLQLAQAANTSTDEALKHQVITA